MPAFSAHTYFVLQRATRALKEGGTSGWCQNFEHDGRSRYCAVGRIRYADDLRPMHISPALQEIQRAGIALGLPRISMVNDGFYRFHGLTGYEGAIALMEHLLDVCAPDWVPSVVQGSQHVVEAQL